MPEVRYTFGSFVLYPGRRLLLDGGAPVRLGARAFDLLVALAERSGQVISKEELLSHAWPSLSVEEVALRVHMSALRKALLSTGGGASLVSNVPGRGYVLTAPVQRVLDGEAAPAAPTRGANLRLPSSGKRLIGRDEVVDALGRKLRQAGFMTVAGPGGIGKTSAALKIAEMVAGDYPDGVIFVDLATLTDAEFLWSAIANAAGLAIGMEDAEQTVSAAFVDKSALLILDNCEHLVEAAAAVADALRASLPSVHILATSREPLRAGGEQIHRLPPLAIPSEADMHRARDYAAIQLLVERATASDDAFSLKDSDLPAATALCRRLDGMPLAIELVASNLGAFGLRAVAERLDDWLLTAFRGARTAARRHQTMAAAIDWSFEVLPERDQRVLMELAIFQGGMNLDMAIGVISGDDSGRSETLQAIHDLHEKSLLSADLTGEDIEYRLLETTRAYGIGKLAQAGLLEAAQRRHAQVMAALVARADALWDVMPRSEWIGRYGGRLADLRAAVSWALSPDGDLDRAAELLAYGAGVWIELGLPVEFHNRLSGLLDRLAGGARIDPRLEMRVKLAWAGAWTTSGTSPEMLAASEEGLAIAENLDAPLQKMQAFWLLWNASTITGLFDEGLIDRIRALTQSSTDPIIQLAGMRILALTLHYQGRQDEAWRFQERMDRYDDVTFHAIRRIGYYTDQKLSHITLAARLLWLRGFPEQAMAAAHRGIAHADALSSIGARIYFLGFAACPVALWSGDTETSQAWVARMLELSARHGFAFWHALGQVYAQIIPRLGQASVAPGQALPPDADQRYLFNQRQLFASFHLDFAAPAIVEASESLDLDWCQPEALRAKALQSEPQDCERLLRRAVAVARRQGALSWELRAATSLARCLRAQVRAQEGRTTLQGVYDRFTEGHRTGDLLVARHVLDELAAATA